MALGTSLQKGVLLSGGREPGQRKKKSDRVEKGGVGGTSKDHPHVGSKRSDAEEGSAILPGPGVAENIREGEQLGRRGTY